MSIFCMKCTIFVSFVNYLFKILLIITITKAPENYQFCRNLNLSIWISTWCLALHYYWHSMSLELAMIFIDIEICHKTKKTPAASSCRRQFLKVNHQSKHRVCLDEIPTNSHPRDCLYLSGLDYAILLEQPHQTQLSRDRKQIKESRFSWVAIQKFFKSLQKIGGICTKIIKAVPNRYCLDFYKLSLFDSEKCSFGRSFAICVNIWYFSK